MSMKWEDLETGEFLSEEEFRELVEADDVYRRRTKIVPASHPDRIKKAEVEAKRTRTRNSN
jgi:hypothetical protein